MKGTKSDKEDVLASICAINRTPISIRYALKAALWEKKGNGSSWYFHRLCLDNPPGYASTSWNSCPWSSPCPSTLILMADWIWLNHTHCFLLLPFDMLTFCWHASTLFKTKKCMLLNSDISGLPSVVSGRFCQRNFVTMSLELWSRFESSSTWLWAHAEIVQWFVF